MRTIYRFVNGRKVAESINEKPVFSPSELKKRRRRKPRVVRIGIAQGYSDATPGRSMGMGCHSSQIGKMNEIVRARGISGVEYVPRISAKTGRVIGGKPVITSRRGRAEWMKVYGRMSGVPDLHDNSGGYGDG